MRKRTIPWACLLFLLAYFPLSSQNPTSMSYTNDPYESAWKTIDSLDNQGLPKSSLEKVTEIYQQAKQDNNPAQQAKAALRIGVYKGQLAENGMLERIAFLQTEEATATFPIDAILQSVLGELYMSYLRNQLWRIRQRASTTVDPGTDITTWSVEQLLNKSTEFYLASISSGEQLKALPINLFDAITSEGENADALRPSLFDFLAHRAVDHFSDDLSYITQPAYQFTIQDETAFAPAAIFAKKDFQTEDVSSFPYITLNLLQDILQQHLDDSDPAALVDADLKRLNLIHRKAALPKKDSLYQQALIDLSKAYENHTVYTEIIAKLAEFKVSQARRYQSEKAEEYRWEAKEAFALCQQAIDKFPKSYGTGICQNIQQSIQRKQLSLKIESVIVPVQPSLLWVGYSNITEAHLQVIKIPNLQKFNEFDYDEKLKFIKRQKAVQTWSQQLPDEGDFQFHSVELAIPVLDIGNYVIVVSDTKKLKEDQTKAEFVLTTVSQLAYLHRYSEENQVEFAVVNRSSGAPIPEVKAEFFSRLYNRTKRSYELNKIGESLSDENGFIRHDIASNVYFRVKLSQGQDVLFIEDGYSNYNRNEGEQKQQTVHFFLDRAIYRPGQTIFFKGILLEKNGETQLPSILKEETITVKLHDANGQEVSELELTSNEYGSVHGSFVAPSSGLLGQMFLRTSIGSAQYFRVEEYKRPRFEVNFEPLEEQAQLEANVQVVGKAEGFAGDMVQEAKVEYRVVREVRYPWMPWWRRSSFRFPGGRSASMEIANGTTQTDATGKFEIDFLAQTDPSVLKENNPAFIFTVYADVTDITGETHSSQKSVKLAYLGLEANVQVPESANREDSLLLQISTTNLDGQLQAVNGMLKIERLLAPGHPYLNRYWDKPDYHALDKETFIQQFPLFAYDDEDQKQNWLAIGSLYNETINTGTTKQLRLDTRTWPVGHYRLSFETQDAKGQKIEVQQFFQLYDLTKKEMATDQWLWTQFNQQQYEPKDLVELTVASSIENWNLLYEIDRPSKKEEAHWIKLEKWLDLNELVQEEDRGNFHIKLAAVRYNRVYAPSLTVVVPWTNKQLNIEYSTFRDKLRPGEDEEWQIKISGPNSERVAAEMVASMYDASLDQFVTHNWTFAPFPTYYRKRDNWAGAGFDDTESSWLSTPKQKRIDVPSRQYRELERQGGSRFGGIRARTMAKMAAPMMEMSMQDSAPGAAPPPPPPPPPAAAQSNLVPTSYNALEETVAAGGLTTENREAEEAPISPRTNLNETVFFLPKLKTDSEGNILISFKMNESLTRWKFLAFAHTQDLAFAVSQQEIVTQKELMVLPSPPRFFREGDQLVFAAKVSNLTEAPLSGTARLELLDARTQEVLDLPFGNDQANISFQTDAKGSAGLEWALKIPANKTSAVIYRVTARAGTFSDGEEAALPVLTNRMLVTESKPLAINGGETKTFELEGLGKALASPTAKPHQFTLEFTSNPAWYAVQALPYLMEYPYECTEQIFNRYYANALASSAANRYPQVREVFNKWRDQGQEAMLSNLRKNQDLKAVLLEETPWVLAAQTEEEQKQNIGLLFDLDRMSREEESTLAKLEDRQSADGSFSWFPGGRESWHITQYVVEGIGRLKTLGVADPAFTDKVDRITTAGIGFIDRQLKEQYERLERLVKEEKTKWEDDHLNSLCIHYLYTRSLFPTVPMEEGLEEIVNYYIGQTEKYWLDKGLYEQGLIALALSTNKASTTPQKILASLQERALRNEELGMYWKYPNSWYWNQLPIETHALLIDVFSTLNAPANEVEALKIWLLKNKQTNHWPTTTATASAVYALLHSGDNWLAETQKVKITFPGWSKRAYADKIETAQNNAEAGTGYFSTKWDGSEMDSDISKVKVKNPNKGPAWGAAYWQYFEDLDKIQTFEETPLTLKKQLFLEKAGDRGPVLEPIAKNAPLHPGDKLVIRLELRVDRAMEYVHMKDTRAAGLEPINVLSQYRWQDGLGYYESPGDAATNFFMASLPVGTYVFEYPLRVTYKGDFSNGITSIQCMYAPEFSSHSAGGRIMVE